MKNNPHRKDLHRLIYFSCLSPAFPSTEAEQDVEIGKIVRNSVHNNRGVSVTGLLLVYQTWFIQVLEGPAGAVGRLYSRILLDPRHHNGVVVVAGPVPTRKFPTWTMCARRLSPTDDEILQTLDQKVAFDPHRLTPDSALRLLTIVGDIQSRNIEPDQAAA